MATVIIFNQMLLRFFKASKMVVVVKRFTPAKLNQF